MNLLSASMMFKMPVPVLALTWGQALVAFVLASVCVLLILIVLIQKGRGGGLSSAFGGGGGGGGAFGAKTGDVFTWITVSLAFGFLIMTIIGNYVWAPTQPIDATEASITAPIPGETIPVEVPADTPVTPAETEKPTPAAGSGATGNAGTDAGSDTSGNTAPPAGEEGGEATP